MHFFSFLETISISVSFIMAEARAELGLIEPKDSDFQELWDEDGKNVDAQVCLLCYFKLGTY